MRQANFGDNLFSKLYKDTQKKIVEVLVNGASCATSLGKSSFTEPTVVLSKTPPASMNCPIPAPHWVLSVENEYGTSYFSKELSYGGDSSADREAIGVMLSATDINLKNSLFFGGIKNALNSAIYNIFIETCKQNGILFRDYYQRLISKLKSRRTDYDNILSIIISIKQK